MFDAFPMPSFSNYPYAYAFDNDEEQYRIATTIRSKAEEISRMNRQDNFMEYWVSDAVVRIVHSSAGHTTEHTLKGMESQIYLAAANEPQDLQRVSETLDIPASMVRMVLDDLEQRGLILYSEDREAFLSLAMRGED
jgi:hypothetical protein